MTKHPYIKDVPPPPPLEQGQLVEVDYLQIKQVEGQYGPQYEFNGVIKGDGYMAKAWVKKHGSLTKNQKLGKLCLLVEKHLGRVLSGPEEAIRELASIGVFFEVTGFRPYQGKTYPKFAVCDTRLPGTQAKIEAPVGEIPESKAKKIVEHIVAHTAFSTEQINDMVAEELANSGNLFDIDMAAILVARTLKVDLETTGERIA